MNALSDLDLSIQIPDYPGFRVGDLFIGTCIALVTAFDQVPPALAVSCAFLVVGRPEMVVHIPRFS